MILWGLFSGSFFFLSQASAETDLECYRMPGCRGFFRGASPNPTVGSQVRINPSAVPTANAFGLEGIFFKDSVDVSIVRGNGRVGAALSPTNSEETFFGPPTFEVPEDYALRKINADKYPNQKLTLAAAVDLKKRSGSGLGAVELKAGVMGRYNKLTHNVSPGVGLNGILGPLTFGGSIYSDETQLDYRTYGLLETKPVVKYQVQTYNVGLFLNSLILDYSQLRMKTVDTSIVHIVTASLSYRRVILSASKRTEDSERPAYNYRTKLLEDERYKEEYFGGLQVQITKNFMVGALYNYYLLHEMSGSLTLFF
ncbi:MAG: hypothetical protein ACAH59_11170 [Pseudobdellovibrionaceae bacterium]